MDLGNCRNLGKVSKSAEGRVLRRSFLTPRARGLLHWCEMRVSPVLKEGLGGSNRLLENLCSLGPKGSKKTFLHPPLSSLGDFPFLSNFPGLQNPNTNKASLLCQLPQDSWQSRGRAFLWPNNYKIVLE